MLLYATASPVFVSEYYLKDHLGNTRVSFLGKTLPGNAIEITGKTGYYPFGLAMSQYSTNIGSDFSKNKYLYNGKEIQDDKLNETFFGWLDYGARFYDPQIGRWHSVDPAIEEDHYNYTPFAYVYNNPIILIDPFGLDSTKVEDGFSQQMQQTVDNVASFLNDPDRIDDALTEIFETLLNDPGALMDKLFNGTVDYLKVTKDKIESGTNAELGEVAADAFTMFVVGKFFGAETSASSKVEAPSNYVELPKGSPKPSPKFVKPTNSPQYPPTNIPEGFNLRIMNPTQQYPNGYWVIEKPMPQGGFQKVNPSTMKPGPNQDTHIPFPNKK